MNPSSSRSGRRRRGSRRRSDHRSNDRSQSAPSLWQRIVSFFKGSGRKSSRPTVDAHPPSASTTTYRPSSKTELIEVSTPRLYIGNLSFQATERDLTELFKGVGGVASAEVVTHRATERSKGFAFVQMNSVDEAKRAVRELHDQAFMGRKLVVSGAKVADERDTARFAA